MNLKKLSAMFIYSCLIAAVISCGKKSDSKNAAAVDEEGYIEAAKDIVKVEVPFSRAQWVFKTVPFAKPNSNDFYKLPPFLELYFGDLEDEKITVQFNDIDQTTCVYSGIKLVDDVQTIPLEQCNNGKYALSVLRWDKETFIHISTGNPISYARVNFYAGAYLPSRL
ncbi:hypothetical protein [Fluviispira vulneris]|uniref:hypothetical protein n=1 Tax=Fluviispira vulneris TaxID=2763012 RepID=UPI001645B6B9|nr:hypothetical protein [Fluviispira vulneris]